MSHTAQPTAQQSPSVRRPATTVRTPPGPVRAAFALWVTAVAAGVFETVLAVGELAAEGPGSVPEIVAGLAVRLPVFAAALLVALRMRRGHGWARIVLALGLGVVGTASMVLEPIRALAQGRGISAQLARADTLDLLFGASRVLHTTAVLAAVVLMFLPAAHRYSRLTRADRAAARNRQPLAHAPLDGGR